MPFEDSPSGAEPPSPRAGDRVVVLLEPPSRKIEVIKAIRLCAAIGLKDAKELVEQAPTPVLAYVSPAEADILYRKLVEAGAKVTIESVDRYSESELAHAPQSFVASQPAAGCLGVGVGVLLLLLATTLLVLGPA
ncbi:MAG: ribosomal protein L7/L12 [Acidobacteria bacterium]|nr:ribosomal protein L7/L12 [Acidobacteriota bacterium]MDA1233578.1 ribosomal protein L7/L12 [Acidobacteriota bacterium]